MTYIMPLLVVGVSSTAINVVTGPVALQRGGASPVPCAFSLYRLQLFL